MDLDPTEEALIHPAKYSELRIKKLKEKCYLQNKALFSEILKICSKWKSLKNTDTDLKKLFISASKNGIRSVTSSFTSFLLTLVIRYAKTWESGLKVEEVCKKQRKC